jgi:hypothetical protein
MKNFIFFIKPIQKTLKMSNNQIKETILDKSTLYVNAASLDADQISTALETLRETLVEYFPEVTEYKRFTYIINVVEASTTGVAIARGLSYIRISEPMIYNILVGLNPDGSERIEIRPNPSFIEPPYPTLTSNEFEDKLLINRYNEEMANSTVTVQLPPIIKLSKIRYDKEQYDEIIEKWEDDLIEKGLDPDNYYTSDVFAKEHPRPDPLGIIEVSSSFITIPNNPKREPWTRENDGKERKIIAEVKEYNKIMSPNCPSWIGERNNAILHELFDTFSTDKSYHPEVINGVTVQVRNYPQFVISDMTIGKGNDKKNVKKVDVIFSPEERYKSDASFCLQMRTKNEVKSVLNPNYKAKIIFVFNWVPVENVIRYPPKISPVKSEPNWVRSGVSKNPTPVPISQKQTYTPIKTQVGTAWVTKSVAPVPETTKQSSSPLRQSSPEKIAPKVNMWAQSRDNNSKFGAPEVNTFQASPSKFTQNKPVTKRWADESPSPPRSRSPLARNNTLPPQKTQITQQQRTQSTQQRPNKFQLPPKK